MSDWLDDIVVPRTEGAGEPAVAGTPVAGRQRLGCFPETDTTGQPLIACPPPAAQVCS